MVHRKKSRRERTKPWVESGADDLGDRYRFPLLHVLLPGRQEITAPPTGGVGHVIWKSLSYRRARMMVLKTELLSTNMILA